MDVFRLAPEDDSWTIRPSGWAIRLLLGYIVLKLVCLTICGFQYMGLPFVENPGWDNAVFGFCLAEVTLSFGTVLVMTLFTTHQNWVKLSCGGMVPLAFLSSGGIFSVYLFEPIDFLVTSQLVYYHDRNGYFETLLPRAMWLMYGVMQAAAFVFWFVACVSYAPTKNLLDILRRGQNEAPTGRQTPPIQDPEGGEELHTMTAPGPQT